MRNFAYPPSAKQSHVWLMLVAVLFLGNKSVREAMYQIAQGNSGKNNTLRLSLQFSLSKRFQFGAKSGSCLFSKSKTETDGYD